MSSPAHGSSGGPPSGRVSPPAPGRVAPYELLKRAIANGEFEPGQPLTEASLARWAGVSRTPIREALRRLEQDGLVERVAQGLVVRTRSPEEILDLYETRTILEATAARVAAERRTEHDLRALRRAIDYGRRVDPNDSVQLVRANEEFHRAIWQASHNESLIDLLERLSLHLARYPGTTLSTDGRWATAQREHDAILDAVARRAARQAHRITEQHFLAARDIRLELFTREAGDRD